jgi:hypothetical protein
LAEVRPTSHKDLLIRPPVWNQLHGLIRIYIIILASPQKAHPRPHQGRTCPNGGQRVVWGPSHGGPTQPYRADYNIIIISSTKAPTKSEWRVAGFLISVEIRTPRG